MSTNSSSSSTEAATPDPLSRSTKKQEVAANYFSGGGTELMERLSRTQSFVGSTHTQDPHSDSFDYAQHLRHALRRGEAEGILTRELGVTFEDIHVTGEGNGLAYGKSMGEILTGPSRIAANRRANKNPATKVILQSFTGDVRPKEMLLVLGRPGSGCSSLLKVLSNNVESFKAVEGNISYDGATPEDMKKNAGDIAYLPEDDKHLPNLTVGDTLTFAAAARTSAKGGRIGSREDTIRDTRDVLVTLFGLGHTLNTKVGNDVVRGVSGGERKRVSIAEMLATGCKLGCHDNSTRGLDASTALEYTRALRIATDVQHLTSVVSIYQASENIYNTFDKVTVLYDGYQVYFGPMGEAVDYFIGMGYQPQNRQTSADFLVAVTDPAGRFVREGYEKRVPRTAAEFAKYFVASKLGQANLAAVQAARANFASSDRLAAYEKSADAERTKSSSKKSPYLISFGMQLRLACYRRYKMQMGELPTLAIVTIAAIFQALIIGSVYFQMAKNTGGFFLRGGVIFFAILYNSFTGLAEITTAYTARPVVVRHRQFGFIRPSADILALNLVDTPFKAVSIMAFDLVIYFMSGLQPSAGQFFIFFLFTYVTNLAMLALFRALASSSRNPAVATAVGGILILVVAIYSGFAIPRPSMHPWFRWLSYAQPVSFSFEALMANEFRTLNVPCISLVPSGPDYPGISIDNQVCAVLGAQTGQLLVDGSSYLAASFGYYYANVWRNFGIIIAYLVFFLCINAYTTEVQRDESAVGAVMLFKRGKAGELEGLISGTDLERATTGNAAFEELKAAISARNHAVDKIKPTTDIFTWRNVCYDVQIKSETRRLLNNVSGYVVPGRMTALMGESGAGKTTLLNVLAQRTDVGIVSGDMLVNGKKLPASFQRQTGYCQQQDTHMSTSTVREALVFSALLRMPSDVPRAEKLEYVEEIIHLLEMDAYAEAIVGDVGFGLNVEQRKRLTIGVELAAKPALLIFLDEPTSGLDSQSSWSIMLLLRKLADHGTSILATIHQPSSELFQVFDRLLLLKKGGETVYFGDLGENSTTLIDYFHARSELRCGPTSNPAEYILEAIGAGASSKTTTDWHGLWKASDEFKVVQQQIDTYHTESAGKQIEGVDLESNKAFSSSFGTQFSALTTRVFQNYWRSPEYLMAKLMLNIVAGLFIGFSFYKTPSDILGLQNKLFAVFMAVVLCAPLSQQLQPKYLENRELYSARERPSAMYGWPAFVLSSIVVEIPFNIFAGTIFYCCWYFTVGFPPETSRAAYAYLMYMLFELYFATFAQWVAALSPNAMAASVLFSTFFSFVIIFNGVVVPIPSLPEFWRVWMPAVTPFRYLIEGLVSNSLGGVVITCLDDQFQFLTPPDGRECVEFLSAFTSSFSGYAQVVNGQCGYCAYATGDQFLTAVSMSYSNRYRDVGLMCLYIASNVGFFFLLTYLTTIVDWSSIGKKVPVSLPALTKETSDEKI